MLVSLFTASAADDAQKTLDSAAAKVRAAGSIKASYTLTSSGTGTTQGTITLGGDRFVMTSPGMTTWYDGTTQWTYVGADNEVNISEPTATELQQINPFVIINSFRSGYTAKSLKAASGLKKISLTAKNAKAQVKSATVTLNASTLMPTEISLTMANGQTATIRVSSLTTGKALPLSTYQFPAKKYPKAEVVDLR